MCIRKAIFFIKWCTLFALYSGFAVAVQLQSLNVQEHGAKTVITLQFAGPFNQHVFTLKNPERVVVDLDYASTKVNVPHKRFVTGLVKRIRRGSPKPNILRFVFDVKEAVDLKVNPASRNLVLELTAKSSSGQSRNQRKPLPVAISESPVKKLRDVVIVIDPGHGGKDPGAIGTKRHLEKDVVLAIAKKLKRIIDKQPGMKAILTRDRDHYIGLRERLNIARKYDADIFISLHADAYINRHSKGVSVFALSQTGATSEAARWLAEKENYSELGGVDLSELDDQNGLVRTVLLDLSQTATIAASLQMGLRVLHALDDITHLHHENVEQARFVVLKSPDIPSILIETGFITNPTEEKNLTSTVYQTRLSQAIFKGIKQYFWEHPPYGSRIEAMSSVKIHVVKAGESLSVIASKYHTSIAKLKTLNNMAHDRVRIGQKLNIPTSIL